LELDAFPRSVRCPLGFSSRFAIAPDHRSTWVLPSLARHAYVHGRQLGAKFDFMATNPGLVRLFERLGYIRYTASAIHTRDAGLLIPMVLPATDHEHLRNTRSACLSAAAGFDPEPEWGMWLRATHPIIGVYYSADVRCEQSGEILGRRLGLPANIASELSALSFVHRFPAGSWLRRDRDRVTCTFVSMDGRLNAAQIDDSGAAASSRAPDGIAFSRVAIWCETDALVLCVPDTAVARLQRRYPEHSDRLQGLLKPRSSSDGVPERIVR
ncbi:MAG TPA: hypothetical protein VK636_21160, partial [Gemmatimonadaceae bacterium]|nr:hypothetical protein [Gemmatimonadaceae bacterium]